MIHCCIGIMAYNEQANIGQLLEVLTSQETRIASIDEIIVVASGCTDLTEAIVRESATRDPRIRLLVQVRKEGKASAVNLLICNTSAEVIILQSADTLPVQGTIEHLVSPLQDSAVGMVGGHPVPTNSNTTFMGYAAHLVWELHHRIALRHPKMGNSSLSAISFTRFLLKPLSTRRALSHSSSDRASSCAMPPRRSFTTEGRRRLLNSFNAVEAITLVTSSSGILLATGYRR